MCALQVPFAGSQPKRDETCHELGGMVQLKTDETVMSTKCQEVKKGRDQCELQYLPVGIREDFLEEVTAAGLQR